MNMANAKILALLRTDRPGVLAVVERPGCSNGHAIAEASREAGVAITHDDLALGAIEWRRLGGGAPAHCEWACALRPRLDHSVVAWTERNLGLHCESIEDMAAAQETMAAASTYLYAGDTPIGEELFRQAARLNTRRAQYQPSLYTNPYQKDESTVRHRATHVRLLKKKRVLEDASRDEQSQEEATKPKAKARRAAKSRAVPKRATRVSPSC